MAARRAKVKLLQLLGPLARYDFRNTRPETANASRDWTAILLPGCCFRAIASGLRLFPLLSPRAIVGSAALVCAVLTSTTLFQTRVEALKWIALDNTGAKLSKAVVAASPSCANVSGMFVQAPENELNHGADMTLGTRQMQDRFSEAYVRAFKIPLLDHNFYRNLLLRNFHPYSYAQLAAEYPCIVVRTFLELNAKTSNGLLELNPDHCLVEGIQVYTVGIACEKIRSAAQNQ